MSNENGSSDKYLPAVQQGDVVGTGAEQWWEEMANLDESGYEERRRRESQLPTMEHAQVVAQRNMALLEMLEAQSLQIALQARQAIKDEQAVLDRLS